MKFQTIVCALLLGAACSGEVTTGKSPSEVVDLITEVNPNDPGDNRPGDQPAGEPYCGCDAILEFCPSFGLPCEGERCAQICDTTGSVCIQCTAAGGCSACPAGSTECQSFTCEQWYDACQSACRASAEPQPPNPPPGGECPDGTTPTADGRTCCRTEGGAAGDPTNPEECFPNTCPAGADCDPTPPPPPGDPCEGGRCCPAGTWPTPDNYCCREGANSAEDCFPSPQCPDGSTNCDPTTPPNPECRPDDPTCRCEDGSTNCYPTCPDGSADCPPQPCPDSDPTCRCEAGSDSPECRP